MLEIMVLDTHIWFWLMTQEFERFPDHWREKIDTAQTVGVSPLSCYEIALAHQRRRLELPCAANEWFKQALDPAGICLLPLTSEITFKAVKLSPIHRDPFDRMIMATALEYHANLASIDKKIAQYPEVQSLLLQP
ncbi:type II toxin-antitoxin system VapC family toxin [Spirulina sp. CS-785/01]|uniref:type II toxin-antitoxin system VapC family toxin n=1 Tax=Spirulina sp. CS-785/01 TaxID=3021716 RepID=UPI002A3D00CC|nr:type II toxin-antitoxin system VapC family toxin [Spirulina sp. CS-785/01]